MSSDQPNRRDNRQGGMLQKRDEIVQDSNEQEYKPTLQLSETHEHNLLK